MTTSNGRSFNEWLRTQLRARRMSQRQLALRSGVNHSTISRLVQSDRIPSLATATKIARGLREVRDDPDAARYLALLVSAPTHPATRVEYALRADDALDEQGVRQLMERYLAARTPDRRRDGPIGGSPGVRRGAVRSR